MASTKAAELFRLYRATRRALAYNGFEVRSDNIASFDAFLNIYGPLCSRSQLILTARKNDCDFYVAFSDWVDVDAYVDFVRDARSAECPRGRLVARALPPGGSEGEAALEEQLQRHHKKFSIWRETMVFSL